MSGGRRSRRLALVEGGVAPPGPVIGSSGRRAPAHGWGDEAIAGEMESPLREAAQRIGLLLDGEHGPLAGSQRDVLRAAGEAVEFLSSLLSLLGLAERETGGIDEPAETFDIRYPLHDVADELGGAARARRVVLRLALPRSPLSVRGGRETTRTVLRFLLRDALRSVAVGGRVTVSAAKGEGGVIVRLERGGSSRGSRAGRRRCASRALARASLERQGGRLIDLDPCPVWEVRLPGPVSLRSAVPIRAI